MTIDIHERITDLHRRCAGRLTAGLTRLFGPGNLDLVEDVLQEAFVEALERWTDDGVPQNPEAWLFTVAKRKALDAIRRRRFVVPLPTDLAPMLASGYADAYAIDQTFLAENIEEELLRLMFVCAHPLLPQSSQTALILKAVCGLSVPETAQAFLTSDETIAKRVYRARELLRERRVGMDMPPDSELPERRRGVLAALYLLCSEGHYSAGTDDLVRRDVLQAAFHLSGAIADHRTISSPEAHALHALTAFHLARAPARVSPEGEIVLLRDQDRSLWRQDLIRCGVLAVARSASGPVMTAYHLEAAISMAHCIAPSYASTDWLQLLNLYDLRYRMDYSPVVALNRSIVVAEAYGAQAGLDAVNAIAGIGFLKDFRLLWATVGDLHSRLHNRDLAIQHYERALDGTTNPLERRLLQRKLDSVRAA